MFVDLLEHTPQIFIKPLGECENLKLMGPESWEFDLNIVLFNPLKC